MSTFTPNMPANQPVETPERRRKGRIRAHGLKCSLGTIADISASGLRILRKRKPTVEESENTVITVHSEFDKFHVAVKLVRMVQLDDKQWELAVSLVEPTEETRQKLLVHARSAGMKGFAHFD
jgi:adenine C2-methylase RlmN of 23S rRNA A2503 and tRNA A37